MSRGFAPALAGEDAPAGRDGYIRGKLPSTVTPPGDYKPEAIADLLGRTPIFSELSEKNVKSLAKEVKVRYIEPGEFVVKRGEGGLGFYLILAGEVDVRKGSRSLAKLGAGQFFGEMALFDSQPRSADVVTTRPTAVGVLSRWEFEAFAETHPGVHKGMLLELARRLRETNKSLSE